MKKNSLITLILLSSFVVLSACGSDSSTNETTVSSGPEKQLESESASEEPVAPIETSMKKTEASDEINAFELEEDLYPLQMVLSQILDNGWEITDIAETTTQNVNGTDVMVDSGYVLTRGDSQISVFLLEYDCFEGIDPSECEVKAISIFPEQVSSFKLGDAEVIGMTKEDVTVLLGEENFKSINDSELELKFNNTLSAGFLFHYAGDEQGQIMINLICNEYKEAVFDMEKENAIHLHFDDVSWVDDAGAVYTNVDETGSGFMTDENGVSYVIMNVIDTGDVPEMELLPQDVYDEISGTYYGNYGGTIPWYQD